MMEDPVLRELFLQELDGRRGDARLPGSSFAAMARAMTAILNACLQADDVSAAMRVANMANTFYTLCDEAGGPDSDAESDDSLGAAAINGLEGGGDGSRDNDTSGISMAADCSIIVDSCPNSSPDKPPNSTPPPAPFPAPTTPSPTLSSPTPRRRYLQREPSIRNHKWWSSEGFWEKVRERAWCACVRLFVFLSWSCFVCLAPNPKPNLT